MYNYMYILATKDIYMYVYTCHQRCAMSATDMWYIKREREREREKERERERERVTNNRTKRQIQKTKADRQVSQKTQGDRDQRDRQSNHVSSSDSERQQVLQQ